MSEEQQPALYSVEQYSGPLQGISETWRGWVVKEHTLFGGGTTSDSVAYCNFQWEAVRIRDALRLANNQATQSTTTVSIQIDGKEIAKAVLPHMASTIRVGSGKRNF